MGTNPGLKICFMGGKQAGIIGILTILSQGNKISAAVSYSESLTGILGFFKIPVYSTIKDKEFVDALKEADILISVHGREVVNKNLLSLPKIGAINIHPYLYKYKGADPIGRALQDKEFKASVGAHIMQEEIDEGRVLVEEFVDVCGCNSVGEVYNKLYPYYSVVILKALDKVCDEHKKEQQQNIR